MTIESNYYGGKGLLFNVHKKYPSMRDFAWLVQQVQALQGTVGDADSGLVKDVADLKTVVGNSSSGLVKRVSDLENA